MFKPIEQVIKPYDYSADNPAVVEEWTGRPAPKPPVVKQPIKTVQFGKREAK